MTGLVQKVSWNYVASHVPLPAVDTLERVYAGCMIVVQQTDEPMNE